MHTRSEVLVFHWATVTWERKESAVRDIAQPTVSKSNTFLMDAQFQLLTVAFVITANKDIPDTGKEESFRKHGQRKSEPLLDKEFQSQRRRSSERLC